MMASQTASLPNGSLHRGSAKPPSSPAPKHSKKFDPFHCGVDPNNDTMPPLRNSANVSSKHLDRNSYHAPPSSPLPHPGQSLLSKSSSTRAVMSTIMTPTIDLSPVVKKNSMNGPTYGRSHSLIGFDPLATPATTATTPSTASPMIYSTTSSPMMNSASSSPMGLPRSPRFGRPSMMSKLTPDPLPVLAPLERPPSPAQKKHSRLSRVSQQQKKKPLTPAARLSTDTDNNKHRRDIQSFCTSDLRAVSSEAMEQENLEDSIQDIFGISSSSNLNSSESKLEFSASSNNLQSKTDITPLSTLSKITTYDPSKPNELQKDEDKQQEQAKDLKTTITRGLASPRKRIMKWSKKAHRRIKSLENKEGANAAALAAAAKSSLPNTPSEGTRRSSMYPAMIQDLMELSFSQLQMPTLAKPSPTSFLTGKEDEVVRTCELDPSPHQMEIPKLREFVVAARLNEFVENYRRVDQNIDLQQWVGMNRMDLREIKIPQHQPIVQSLLECGDDVSLQGVIIKGASADERTEMVIFEGQRQFTVACRGTTEQQCKLGATMKSKKRIAAVPLDAEHPNVDVYSYFKEEYSAFEAECFEKLDKLTEQNPFCDVCFTGHSFGATIATLSAFRYANARPMMRVSCITLASPKVGFSAFKQLVNSSPNLKVMRLEFGQDGKCQLPSLGGYHVGHTLVLHGSLGHNSLKTSKPVLAYKFDAPKHKKFKTTHPDLRSYVNALEEVARLGLPWAEDFVGTSGQGVVVNNESRQVV